MLLKGAPGSGEEKEGAIERRACTSSIFSGPGLSHYYLGRWWSPGQRALCLLFLPVSSFILPSFPPFPFPIHPSIHPPIHV